MCQRFLGRAVTAVVLAAMLLGGSVGANAAETQDVVLTLAVNGGQRTAFLHLPAALETKRTYPLVIGFHGGLGNAEGYMRNSQLFAKGAAAGFVVICPEGTVVFGDHRVWNSGPEYARATSADDVAFTRALIDAAAARAPIDRKRVYATGFSNGGQMSYRLALELSDEIAAIAPMSGGRLAEGEHPAGPVPVLHVHGTADTVYPLEGGLGAHSIGRTSHVPITEVIAEWAGFDRAAPQAEVHAHDGWLEQAHTGPAPVTLVLVDGMGHQIAGGTDDRLPDQPLRATPDAIAMALTFFLAHPMP